MLEKEAGGRGEKVTAELKRNDIGLLINLLTQEIYRVGETKEKYGFFDPSYFCHLVYVRNKLEKMPVAEELPRVFSDFISGKEREG